MYLVYLKVHFRNQDKSLAAHIVCKYLLKHCNYRQGKNAKLRFDVLMVWGEPTNNFDNCYLTFINVKSFNKKKLSLDIPSAIWHSTHCDEINICTVFARLPKINDIISRTTSNADESERLMFFCYLMKILIRLLCLLLSLLRLN